MNGTGDRLAGHLLPMRRLRALAWVAAPFLAFLVWVYLPDPSTPVSRMMAATLPETASGAEPLAAAHADELPPVRGVAAPDD